MTKQNHKLALERLYHVLEDFEDEYNELYPETSRERIDILLKKIKTLKKICTLKEKIKEERK